MAVALFLIGTLGFIVFIIVGLISLIKKNEKGKKNFGIAGACLVVMVISFIAVPTPEAEQASTPEEVEVDANAKDVEEVPIAPAKQAEERVEEAIIEPEQPPTEEPKQTPAVEVSIDTRIKNEINEALGEKSNNNKNRIVDLTINEERGFVRIVLSGDDNLTNNLTKVGMLSDVEETFPILFKNSVITDAMISIQLPLVDQYGNTTDGEVMAMELDRATHEQINYENFNPENFATIAKNYFVHPALNK